eukprot:3433908-Prymnesium_polylepis.2
MSMLRDFANAHHLSAETSRQILTYFDAVWSERKGFDARTILGGVPAHMLPKVLRELHQRLIFDEPFINELSYKGSGAFLYQLKHDICERGDLLIRMNELREQCTAPRTARRHLCTARACVHGELE